MSSNLPVSMHLTTSGLLYGNVGIVPQNTVITFTVRAVDSQGSFSDKTFSFIITASSLPTIDLSGLTNLVIADSVWFEYQLPVNNVDSPANTSYRITQGKLPDGLELTDTGIIRGYPAAHINKIQYAKTTIKVTGTNSSSNSIICDSTLSISIGRPIKFDAPLYSDFDISKTYYISRILSLTSFTISDTTNSTEMTISVSSNILNIVGTLLAVDIGKGIDLSFSFKLSVRNSFGSAVGSGMITIRNQQLDGKTRYPVLLNTRPKSILVDKTEQYAGYYLFSVPAQPDTQATFIGTVVSGENFAYKFIGNDFDPAIGNGLKYIITNLPSGFTFDNNTGWLYGSPIVLSGINYYTFAVATTKQLDSGTIQSALTYFSLAVKAVGFDEKIVWKTDTNLGTVSNGDLCHMSVYADATTPIHYRIKAGVKLPPNLTLSSSGDLQGIIAWNPTSTEIAIGTTSSFSFIIEAVSDVAPKLVVEKEFTLHVKQQYKPSSTLYVKASPNIKDRRLIKELLSDDVIDPALLYRPGDVNFGKAKDIVYEHLYGLSPSKVFTYLQAMEKNHYWKHITLGPIKHAIGRDNNGILYEVIYSDVIDNTEPKKIRNKDIKLDLTLPVMVDLQKGPWYTSMRDLYSSYAFIKNTLPTYHTSLSPGYLNSVHPNSLRHMRKRLTTSIDYNNNSNLLPLWMRCQQLNGSTLGYIPAWVICYALPGKGQQIINDITTKWKHSLNEIYMTIDRFTVDNSNTFDYDPNFAPPAWTNLPSNSVVDDSKNFHLLFPQKTILPGKQL